MKILSGLQQQALRLCRSASYPQFLWNLLFWMAFFSLLTFGALTRSWGVLDGALDFWADEAWWTTKLLHDPINVFSIRPSGYMLLNRWISSLSENYELTLRLPSLLAGVGATLMISASALLILRNKWVLLLIAWLAVLSPTLIVFSKEFKPYSVEVFIHAGLTFWALYCLRSGRSRKVFWLAVLVSILICYNVVFLLPAFALALIPAFAARWRHVATWVRGRMHPVIISLISALPVIIFLSLNDTLAGLTGAAKREIFWGEKYDVFAINMGPLEVLRWYAWKTWNILTAAVTLNGVSSVPQSIIRAFFFTAYITGVCSLLRTRQTRILALLVGPLLTVGLVNSLGYWPYGSFRTNWFLVPATLLVAGIGLDSAMGSFGVRGRLVLMSSIILVVIASLPSDLTFFRTKSIEYGAGAPQLTRVLKVIQERYEMDSQFVENIIMTDWHSWRPLEYYMKVSPKGRKEYREIAANVELVRGPLNSVGSLSKQIEQVHNQVDCKSLGTRRVWIVVTKLSEFSQIRFNPLVRKYSVYEHEFEGYDPEYHPLLIELRF